jgi:hypothetical protein
MAAPTQFYKQKYFLPVTIFKKNTTPSVSNFIAIILTSRKIKSSEIDFPVTTSIIRNAKPRSWKNAIEFQ